MTQIEINYKKYLDESQHIGFMSDFPIQDKLETFKINTKCRNIPVEVIVHYCKLQYGSKPEDTVAGLVTERLDISKYLPLNGFASNCCYDEATTMEEAIVEIARQKNVMICNKINSWPFAKAVIQDNFYKD